MWGYHEVGDKPNAEFTGKRRLSIRDIWLIPCDLTSQPRRCTYALRRYKGSLAGSRDDRRAPQLRQLEGLCLVRERRSREKFARIRGFGFFTSPARIEFDGP